MPILGDLRFIALAAGALAILATGPARADGKNSIGLTGTVATRCDLAVKPHDGTSSLSLASQSSVDLATIREVCLNRSGYTIRLFTKNGARNGAASGVLTTDEGQGTVPYSVTYGGSPVRFVDGVAVVQVANGKTSVEGVARTLAVALNGTQNQASTAAYTDTLVIAITGN